MAAVHYEVSQINNLDGRLVQVDLLFIVYFVVVVSVSHNKCY